MVSLDREGRNSCEDGVGEKKSQIALDPLVELSLTAGQDGSTAVVYSLTVASAARVASYAAMRLLVDLGD